MSLEYGGKANLVAEDEKMVLYEYSCFGWNVENLNECKFDGVITIDKSCFINAEHRRKTRKTSHGKKFINL